MGKWVHRILEYDEENNLVNCENCGWVPRRNGPNGIPRCQIAKKKYKGKGNPYVKGPHGLTIREAQKLREGKSCAICGGPGEAVDHDHETGKIRGILCKTCNTGVGMFKDSKELLAAAILYLEEN